MNKEQILKILKSYNVERDFMPFGEDDIDNIISNLTNELFGNKAFGWAEEISDGKYDINIEFNESNKKTINLVLKAWKSVDIFVEDLVNQIRES